MKPPMLFTAYKVSYTRNAYGDYIATGEVGLACHFRYINQVVLGENNETMQSDAMAWFEPDSGVGKGDILKIDGEHFQVERVIKARRLHSPNVEFIKVELRHYGIIS